MKGFFGGNILSAMAKGILATLAVMGAGIAPAQDMVTATIESVQTRASGHPEVTIQLQSNGLAPTSVVLFIAFESDFLVPDSDYFETVARDIVGNVIRDEDGNATVFRSAVKPAAALTSAGKVVDFQVYAEDVIGIAISGINEDPIPAGAVLNIGFKAQPGISAADSSLLQGITAATAINVTNPNTGARELAQSSAASVTSGVETPLDIQFFDGTVLFSCPSTVPAVTNLSASTNDAESVVLTWDSGSALQFRVFRANSNDFSQAKPLGDGWLTARTFSDFSATPGVAVNQGCFGGTSNGTRQFYWVIARDNNECESAATGSVTGSRAPAKSNGLDASSTMAGLLVAGTLTVSAWRRRRQA